MTVSHQIILAGLAGGLFVAYCFHSLLQRHERRVQEELRVVSVQRSHLRLLPAPWDQAKDVAS